MDTSAPHFSFTLRGEFLRLCVFSQLQIQVGCWQPSVFFPWGCTKCSNCVLSPNPTVSLAFYMCFLAVCRSSHLPPLGTLTESRLGVHVGEACIALGVPVSQLGGSSFKLPGAACCQIFLMESGKWLVGPYSFDEFWDLAAVLAAFPYPSDIQITSAFCWVRKNWATLSATHTAR